MATNPKDVPQHHYTLEEYFALEDASDARFEYWDGDIICMSGGRARGTISSNVVVPPGNSLRGGRCDATDLDAPVELESIGHPLKLREIYDGVTFAA